jgi:Tfp pilus assembly protein PilO
MSSARQSAWRRRLPLLAVAAVFAGGNFAVFLTYRSSTQSRREALEARRDALTTSVTQREEEAARLSSQKARLGGVSAAMDEFYGHRIGTQRATLAAVVADIHEKLNEVGVTTTQISYSTAPMQKLPLEQMKIQLPVKCDYARFKRLLRAFETGRRWIAVRTVAIQRDTERPGSVNVQLELVTYFTQGEGAEPTTPHGPAKPAPAKAAPGAVAARRTG